MTPSRSSASSQAISSFERTLISGDAPYDRFVYGSTMTAMSPAAQRGMTLFFGERAECYHCHAGPNFSTSFRSATSEAGPPDFQNNGLYNLDGGRLPARQRRPLRVHRRPA
jgi:cytochrome c peroxidase